MNGEMTFSEIFAKNLKVLLAYNGKNQRDLSKYMGCTTSTVSDWCSGKKTPRANKMDKICEFLHCSITDLAGDSLLSFSDISNRLARRELTALVDSLNESEVSAVIGFIKTMRSYANESN